MTNSYEKQLELQNQKLSEALEVIHTEHDNYVQNTKEALHKAEKVCHILTLQYKSALETKYQEILDRYDQGYVQALIDIIEEALGKNHPKLIQIRKKLK
jgi:hypothetical protein